jgi:N-acetylglucosaminyldiphosphoundecaprenol N-acetyl-beta-D-mannosaminyltransferase
MTAEVLYLSGGARVSTRPDTESLGPRSHVLGVVNAFTRLGFRVRPYIVGDEVPERFGQEGSEAALERSRASVLLADLARFALRWRSRARLRRRLPVQPLFAMTTQQLPRDPRLPRIHPLPAAEVTNLILRRTAASRPLLLGNLNLHGLYMYRTDDSFRSFCDQADLVLVDGWPLKLLAREEDGRRTHSIPRVGSTDWLFPLIDADPALTIVAVGGSPHVARAAAARIRERTSRLRWLAYDGFEFRGATSESRDLGLPEALRAADLVVVGMGMPTQEKWILEHRQQITRAVVANVGGCLDYLAGEQVLAPRWLGPLGLEWLFRLLRDPRRLAERYLVEPLRLLHILIRRRQPPWVRVAGTRS